MALVLLDSRRLVVLVFSFTCALGASFTMGYVAGNRSVQASLPDAVAQQKLAFAMIDNAPMSTIESVPTTAHAAGADSDVDRADNAVSVELESAAGVQMLVSAGPIVAPQDDTAPARSASIKPELIDTAQVPAATTPAKRAATPSATPAAVTTAGVATSKAVAGADSAPARTPEATNHLVAIGGPPAESQHVALLKSEIVDDASAHDAIYSIQVGIYGNLENAERHVDELSAQKLSAYLDEYRNKNDEPRYNVRFGYFASRASAVTALQRWEQRTGTGLVVRLPR
jgi:cell division septation protein DedD